MCFLLVRERRSFSFDKVNINVIGDVVAVSDSGIADSTSAAFSSVLIGSDCYSFYEVHGKQRASKLSLEPTHVGFAIKHFRMLCLGHEMQKLEDNKATTQMNRRIGQTMNSNPKKGLWADSKGMVANHKINADASA